MSLPAQLVPERNGVAYQSREQIRIDVDGNARSALTVLLALAGFICGVVFGALVSTAEKGQPILDLPLIRAAMWGILVSVALALATGKGIPEMLVTVPLGAVSAMASVAIVRKWAALPVMR